jgi:O-antigen/teichoic acid export membrane protein
MSLGKNASLTMISAVAQFGITLITVPFYLSMIGLDRFGVIVLIWLIFEYLNLLSLGLDRASINFLARHRNDSDKKSKIFWSAILASGISSSIGGIAVYLLLPYLLERYLSVDAKLIKEIGSAFFILPIFLITNIIGTILSSLLQADERFVELNIAQFCSAVSAQVLPVLAAYLISPTLETVLITGCVAKSTLVGIFIFFVLKKKYRLGKPDFSKSALRQMFNYGAWTSISGIVSPIIVNLDRILIGSISGPAAVSLYAVPYNLVTKALLIPSSLSSALFPRLSATNDRTERSSVSSDVITILGIVYSIGLLFGSFLFEPFLKLWLKQILTTETIYVGQILILGLWFNGMAFIPYVFLLADGRPDVAAKIHMIEVVPFIALLWLLVLKYGIVGASIAWAIRAATDSTVLFFMSGHFKFICKKLLIPTLCLIFFVTVATIFAGMIQLIFATFCFILSIMLLWAWIVAPSSLKKSVKKFFAFAVKNN